MRKTWTDDHQWWAGVRTYELAAVLAHEAHMAGAVACRDAADLADASCSTRKLFTKALHDAGFNAERVRREVQFVDDLASGRKVREVVYRVIGDYAAEEDHVVWEGSYRPGKSITEGRRVVRVKFTRRVE